jgi:hypothetical protein
MVKQETLHGLKPQLDSYLLNLEWVYSLNESHIYKELALKRPREVLTSHAIAAVVAVLSSWSVKLPCGIAMIRQK